MSDPTTSPLGCPVRGWCPGRLPASERGRSYCLGSPHEPSPGGWLPGAPPTNTNGKTACLHVSRDMIDTISVWLAAWIVSPSRSFSEWWEVCLTVFAHFEFLSGVLFLFLTFLLLLLLSLQSLFLFFLLFLFSCFPFESEKRKVVYLCTSFPTWIKNNPTEELNRRSCSSASLF